MNSADQRIYAIGDIHGCRDELSQMRDAIAADLATHPHNNPLIVTLGDYVDRGVDSAGVLDDLIAWHKGPVPVISLRGNHDIYPRMYLDEPMKARRNVLHWLDPRMGGDATLASYGIAGASANAPMATHRAARSAIPEHHLRFIDDTCVLTQRVGDYLFVHAGVDPTRPLDDQDPDDLIWIRDGFLNHMGDFGAVVVHGHTPVQQVEHHGNRIAVDTGAVFGRYLSCVIIEDAGVQLLQPKRADGRRALD